MPLDAPAVRRAIAGIRRGLDELEAALAGQPESGNGLDVVEAKMADLVVRCASLAIPVSADGFVVEKHAALLVGRSPWTLRNRRYGDRQLPCRKVGGRWEYSLADLAAYLAGSAEE